MLLSAVRSTLRAVSAPSVVSAAALTSGRHFISVQPATERALSYQDAALPYRWLRDSCQCPQCIHPTSLQKLHRSPDIPIDVAPKPGGVSNEHGGLRIEWTNDHVSFYPDHFLSRYSSPLKTSRFHRDVRREPWDAQTFSISEHKFVLWDEFQTDRGLLNAIGQLERYGLLFISNIPTHDTTNEGAGSRKVAQRFSVLKSTFYGETWNVKNVVNSRNIAYTNLDLGFHSDLQYFEAPPRFQILHCVRNHVQGGTSLFTDALAAAETLRQTDPAAFTLLTSTPVPFHYINDGHHLHHTHPTIELARFPDPQTGQHEITHVNYSPPFQAPLPPDTPPAFFDALGRFAALLEKNDAVYRYTLRKTDAVVFDNRRVLHARTAFTDAEELEGGEGVNRWLQGCYFDADSMMDQGRILREKAERGEL